MLFLMRGSSIFSGDVSSVFWTNFEQTFNFQAKKAPPPPHPVHPYLKICNYSKEPYK